MLIYILIIVSCSAIIHFVTSNFYSSSFRFKKLMSFCFVFLFVSFLVMMNFFDKKTSETLKVNFQTRVLQEIFAELDHSSDDCSVLQKQVSYITSKLPVMLRDDDQLVDVLHWLWDGKK